MPLICEGIKWRKLDYGQPTDHQRSPWVYLGLADRLAYSEPEVGVRETV